MRAGRPSYVLPIRRATPADDELTDYLHDLSASVQVIVVDGSGPSVFAEHHRRWSLFAAHVGVDPAVQFANGKVNGVLTGLALAAGEAVVIADDDVRYDLPVLERTVDLLERFDLVGPQNYYDALPWQARYDTARTLVQRGIGHDFPGTFAVRRSTLERTGGYNGDVLFENLELVRTVQAAGGRATFPADLFVRRHPPEVGHFLGQRVRQAYDEWARPAHLAMSLAVVPVLAALGVRRRWSAAAAVLLAPMAVAERGRRRAGGGRVFPASSTLLAPVWALERGVCAWLAVHARIVRGGCPYAGSVLRVAASSPGALRRRMRPGSAIDQTKRRQ